MMYVLWIGVALVAFAVLAVLLFSLTFWAGGVIVLIGLVVIGWTLVKARRAAPPPAG